MAIFSRSPFGLATAVGAAMVLSGCTVMPAENTPAQNNDRLQVVTTFLPMTVFTQAVVGVGELPADELRADVTQLLPVNVDPHDYQAKPQDVQRLAQADVLVKNGLSFELFLSDLIADATGDDLIVVDASEGIEPILVADHAEDHTDDHAGKDHGDESHDHAAHDHEAHDDHAADAHAADGHAAHDHGPEDPHVWLDPKKAIQQVENIRDALAVADPEGKPMYEANAAAYISQLQALDQKMTETLAPYRGKTFVTHHDFSEHFARSYGLEVEYLVDVPEQSAAPGDVLNVIEAAKASNLKTLLSEPGQQNGPLAAIAKDLDMAVSVFDPLETSSTEAPDPDYYLAVMNQNLANLKAALSQESRF